MKNSINVIEETKASLNEEQVATLTAWGFFEKWEAEDAELEALEKAEKKQRRKEAKAAREATPHQQVNLTPAVETPEQKLRKLEAEINADKLSMAKLEGKQLATAMESITKKRAEYDDLHQRHTREQVAKAEAKRQFLENSFGDGEADFERLWPQLRDQVLLAEMQHGRFSGIPKHNVFNAAF